MTELLYCQIRKTWISSLPEERVRQQLILELTQNLGFPIQNIAIEKKLDQLPHLQFISSLPKRRADLIVFANNLHPHYAFYPLLLVECKSIKLTDKTLRQIVGYNHFVGAPFLAVVNQTDTLFGYYHTQHKDFIFSKKIMPYEYLIKNLPKLSADFYH